MPPEQLGKYRIVGELGVGGMGTVYRAVDTSIDMEVAIKVLHEHLRADEKAVNRFFNDARALGKLKHPNIVQIYATELEQFYFVMELVQGESFKQILAGGLPAKRVLEIGIQAATAIRYIHEANLVHRDIKPHNIIIGPDGRAKLLDFGIARARKSEVTTSRSILGTVEYMSPEQVTADTAVDQRTDIYSLGVVLYEALAGRLPIPPSAENQTVWQMVERILNETPKRLLELRPELNPYLDEIVMRCLEKDPAKRRSNMGEVLVELENALKLMDSSSSLYQVTERRRPFWSKHGKQLGVAAAVLLLAGLGTAGFLYRGALAGWYAGLRAPADAPTAPAAGAVINLNTATVAELDRLPGIGPAIARDIIAKRTEMGGKFNSVEDLRTVSGLGGQKFERIKPHVTVK